MNEANKFKLGAFLLIAITLLIVGFLSAGIMQIFAPKYRAMTVLNTSVEGLAVGSPVKYLGMPVGKITAMAMRESISKSSPRRWRRVIPTATAPIMTRSTSRQSCAIRT